mmetsp:Transcript_8510/g.33658  ORF Transcript_8510/g.33658 Transcript_8510/m.33658 type:complete len:346 (-) Transcript_8510:855-1892(-)
MGSGARAAVAAWAAAWPANWLQDTDEPGQRRSHQLICVQQRDCAGSPQAPRMKLEPHMASQARHHPARPCWNGLHWKHSKPSSSRGQQRSVQPRQHGKRPRGHAFYKPRCRHRCPTLKRCSALLALGGCAIFEPRELQHVPACRIKAERRGTPANSVSCRRHEPARPRGNKHNQRGLRVRLLQRPSQSYQPGDVLVPEESDCCRPPLAAALCQGPSFRAALCLVCRRREAVTATGSKRIGGVSCSQDARGGRQECTHGCEGDYVGRAARLGQIRRPLPSFGSSQNRPRLEQLRQERSSGAGLRPNHSGTQKRGGGSRLSRTWFSSEGVSADCDRGSQVHNREASL